MKEILSILVPLAKAGDAQSQYQLGILYFTGNHNPPGKDFTWFSRKRYQFLTWLDDNRVLQDRDKAMKYLLLAAEQQYPQAHLKLEAVYGTGQGVEIDPWQAVIHRVDYLRYLQNEYLSPEQLVHWRDHFSFSQHPSHTTRQGTDITFFTLFNNALSVPVRIQLPEKTPERIQTHLSHHFTKAYQGNADSQFHLVYLYTMGLQSPDLEKESVAAFCRIWEKSRTSASRERDYTCLNLEKGMTPSEIQRASELEQQYYRGL